MPIAILKLRSIGDTDTDILSDIFQMNVDQILVIKTLKDTK